MARNIPPLLPSETKQKDGGPFHSAHFSGFSKVKNLYITGHSDGAMNFWDVSCPFLLPILSLKQQVSSKLVAYVIYISRNNYSSVNIVFISPTSIVPTADSMTTA